MSFLVLEFELGTFEIHRDYDRNAQKKTLIPYISTLYTSFFGVSAAASPTPLRGTATYISPNATWVQNGVTVAENPNSFFVDENGTLYIAEHWSDRIVEWKYGANESQVVAGGNGRGNQKNQLDFPGDVIVDKETDSLIICDYNNRRVMRWARRNGKSGETIISGIFCWGLTMDRNGSLYVVDNEKHEVRRWRGRETDGTLVAGGNGKGSLLNQLNGPTHIFVDLDDSVYVSDSNNHRVIKLTVGAAKHSVVVGGDSGTNRGTQLSNPRGIVVDQMGTIYVAECTNHRITRWPKGVTEGSVVVGENGKEKQPNQLNCPTALSFDRHGNLYVVDLGNYRLQRFNVDHRS